MLLLLESLILDRNELNSVVGGSQMEQRFFCCLSSDTAILWRLPFNFARLRILVRDSSMASIHTRGWRPESVWNDASVSQNVHRAGGCLISHRLLVPPNPEDS